MLYILNSLVHEELCFVLKNRVGLINYSNDKNIDKNKR